MGGIDAVGFAEVIEVAIQVVADDEDCQLVEGEVSADTTLTDLGLDSINVLELLAALENRFDFKFPWDFDPTHRTPRQIAETINETRAG
jgi:acyl carrier protein